LKDDYFGHAAIRFYYGLPEAQETGRGKVFEKECTDFSSPERFPAVIIRAIKAGDLAGFGSIPEGLLCAPLYADYKAKRATLYADYEAKLATLYADYEAKRAPLYADYEAKRATLYADYEAKRATLYAEGWALFAIPENRAPAWR
jgi:hypothetical protein